MIILLAKDDINNTFTKDEQFKDILDPTLIFVICYLVIESI
jgi:hypothetical protein